MWVHSESIARAANKQITRKFVLFENLITRLGSKSAFVNFGVRGPIVLYRISWYTESYYKGFLLYNMSRIQLRLIRCHWSFDPRWVKISGHAKQLGPCGSTSHFVNSQHSRVKTQGASCIGGFCQTDGRRKFVLGVPKSWGAPYIRGASYIRDKTVLHSMDYHIILSKWL